MKKNGFTLLELLIGISLISIVMIFLFRLLNDIQHEALSNTYIVANQTNRNEMINILDTALYENGDVCSLFIGSSATDRLYKIGFCDNNKEIDITISKMKVKIEYDSHKYAYEMRDSQAYYEIALPYTITTFNGKKYIRFTIVTHKKGLRETIIDDIEMMGTVRTLTVRKENVDEFSYTGDEQEFVAPKTGRYKIELWGASGGKAKATFGGAVVDNEGYGGYTSGIIHLNANDRLYVYVGQRGAEAITGSSSRSAASYNGGGRGAGSSDNDDAGGSGGGATDVRLVNGDWDNAESLASRIMVAAGGAGAPVIGRATEYHGGYAGGLTGVGYIYRWENALVEDADFHATQTTGYQFGIGQDAILGIGCAGSGAGGGYYGGKTQQVNNVCGAHGGGGSSYISGYTGCVAITSITDTTPRNDSDGEECTEESAQIDPVCSEHYSGLKFTSPVMKAGNELMPRQDGENLMIGNEGNGYAIITYLGA